MTFGILFGIGALIALIACILLKVTITWKESLAHLGLQAGLAALMVLTSYCGPSTYDTQAVHGKVVGKQMERVSCRHSYSCNCTTHCFGGENSTCHTICQTCYEHGFDQDWWVRTTVRNFEIDPVDRQGLIPSPRYTAAYTGEPATAFIGWNNWIKMKPDSLFGAQPTEAERQSVAGFVYPATHSYYRTNRALNLPASWNEPLEHWNTSHPGTSVMVVRLKSRDQVAALKKKWLGGKHKDIIILVEWGANGIQWAEVWAWTTKEIFQITLRDRLVTQKPGDIHQILYWVERTLPLYSARNMDDFAYLKDAYEPGPWWWVLCVMLSIITSVGLVYVTHTNDLFDEERTPYVYSYRHR